jgi:hypothetical protein
MARQILKTVALAGAMTIFAVTTFAQQKTEQTEQKDRERAQTQAEKPQQIRERVYGSQLMTRKERAEYHARMRELKTDQERQQFRLEHHQKMQARAKEHGKSLPDMPPMEPGHMAPGGGMGPGGGKGKQ